MSDTPRQDDPEREARIRVRAYLLWEDAGRPHGQDEEFWERARELVAIEENAESGRLPNPATSGADPAPQAESAELQANLGEFPSRMTDQGERKQTPAPRRSRRKSSASS